MGDFGDKLSIIDLLLIQVVAIVPGTKYLVEECDVQCYHKLMSYLSLDGHDEQKEIEFEIKTYLKLSTEQLIRMMKEKTRFVRNQLRQYGNLPTRQIIQRPKS